jgi:hypothetical protein
MMRRGAAVCKDLLGGSTGELPAKYARVTRKWDGEELSTEGAEKHGS